MPWTSPKALFSSRHIISSFIVASPSPRTTMSTGQCSSTCSHIMVGWIPPTITVQSLFMVLKSFATSNGLAIFALIVHGWVKKKRFHINGFVYKVAKLTSYYFSKGLIIFKLFSINFYKIVVICSRFIFFM